MQQAKPNYMNKIILISIGLICSVITACLPLGMAAGCAAQPSAKPYYPSAQDIQDMLKAPFNPCPKTFIDERITLRGEDEVTYISDLYNKKDIIQLRNLIKDVNDNKFERILSIWALVMLDDKESIPEIKKLLKDESELVRYYAKEALKQLGLPVEPERNPAPSGKEEIEEAKKEK